jgi:hypothetical protein
MRVGAFTVVLCAAAAASAALVGPLGAEAGFYIVLPAMLVCLIFAWMLVFERDGMRKPRAWPEFLFYGLLVPVFSNWSKPVSLSFNAQACLVSAAVGLGAILRMLWIGNA